MRGFILGALLLMPAVSSAQDQCVSDARRIVDAAYRQVLERTPNRAVTDPYVTQLMQGRTTVREIMRDFAMSWDHRQRFLAANTPAAREAAVAALYRHLLGRDADPAGLQAHASAFINGDPEPVITSMIDSSEYQQMYGDDMVPGARLRYCGANANSTAGTATGIRRNRFWNMDRNGNNVIEREEWNGSQTSFAVHDWNRDGVLSGDEVRPGGRRGVTRSEDVDFDPAGSATWTEDAFRQLDSNGDGRINSAEWFYAPEFFWRADRNRDATLTLSEFTSTAWDDDRDDRFENLDMNRNGRVERSEWHGSYDAFQWLDRNNDNVLSRAEVVGAAGSGEFNSFTSLDANRNGSLSVSEWRWSRASFNRYDANQDGMISRQEFATAGGSPVVR